MNHHVESSICIAAFWLFGSVVASCAGQDANFHPGASDVPRPVSSLADPAASSVVPRWERFSELASMKEIAPTFPARGHGTGEWNAQMRGNELAANAIATLRRGSAMPKGSVLVELHTDKKGGVPLDGFIMEKRELGYFPEGGDWDYSVVSVDGSVLKRGRLDFCARCHAEGSADFVFIRPATVP